MRVLLVNPGFGPLVSRGRHNRSWPPLDLLNCAALAEREGHQAVLLDLRARPRQPEEILREAGRADLILLTTSPLDRWQCPNPELEPVLDLAALLPRENLFLTGVQGTLFPKELLETTGARGVVRGEPEEAIRDLVRSVSPDRMAGLTWRRGGEIRTNPDRRAADISEFPFPAYHLLDLDDYSYELLGPRLGLVETSRGCPYHCPFCLKAMYPPGLRSKPVERVLEETVRLIEDCGARSLYFFDLEFTARRDRTEEICRGLSGWGGMVPWTCQTRLDDLDEELIRIMARAGCGLIHLGIETADQELQEKAGKPIDPVRAGRIIAAAREAGIRTAAFFLLGLAGQTPRQAERTVDLALRLKPTYASFHLQTPYPGTDWGAEAASWESWSREQKRREADWAGTIRRAYRRFYLRPGYVVRALKEGTGLREGIRLFRNLSG